MPGMASSGCRALQALLVAIACLASLDAGAQSYQEGTHYSTLEPPRATSSGAKVEVIEFFYYGCPVCYEAEPLVVRGLSQNAAQGKMRRLSRMMASAMSTVPAAGA